MLRTYSLPCPADVRPLRFVVQLLRRAGWLAGWGLRRLLCFYFRASGVTVSVIRRPSRSTMTRVGWPIFAASNA
jgi:hypothetical protein